MSDTADDIHEALTRGADAFTISRDGGWLTDGRFATLDEIIDGAREELSVPVWDLMQGGTSEERTLHENRAAFHRWDFRPVTMAGVAHVDTSVELLGERCELPLFIAPFADYGAFHATGWRGLVRASVRMGIPAIVPIGPMPECEDVAATVRPHRLLAYQIVPHGPEAAFLETIEKAAAAGYRYACVTDAPIVGWRERIIAHRAELGSRAGLRTGPVPPRDTSSAAPWDWQRLAAVRDRSALPWIYKGVLTGEDARSAIEAGVSAVYVSNIGGRQLDSAPATIDQLPEIVDAVAGEVPVLVDGGIRRAPDVVKALALGADSVGMGRLMAMALAAAGEQGVVRALQLLQAELVTTMTLLGRGSITRLDRSALQPSRNAATQVSLSPRQVVGYRD